MVEDSPKPNQTVPDLRRDLFKIEEIKRGLAEADAGEFASDAEVVALFEKWRHLGRGGSFGSPTSS
ncbi:hypothetical protein FRZ44_46730 [Hypericibacter terrae]|jgi:predicted transcriptional regulator|uniref:Uncharacterized protein n=1 Tax=Hypericibacter terrae TaxID=2602015 RepID=A0A5J6MTL3_9PROT|nr:hypothetical protein FRZ44_46730 [Hypericibacter terrae]